MPWRIAFDEPRNCITLTFEGLVTEADVRASTAAVYALFAERATRNVLTDLSAATGLALSTVDIFKQAQEAAGDMREAIVCPRHGVAYQAVVFYETVCRNRGKTVRAFEAIEPALDWLAA